MNEKLVRLGTLLLIYHFYDEILQLFQKKDYLKNAIRRLQLK